MRVPRKTIVSFLSSEDGAVTVDWVVLTAGLVGLGLATIAVASGGVENLSNDVGQSLANQETGPQFGLASAEVFGITPENFVSWHHSEQWVTDTVAAWSDPGVISDQALVAHYNSVAATAAAANPADVANGHYHNSIDHMGAAEAAMRNRGIEVPDAGIDYETAYNNFQNS